MSDGIKVSGFAELDRALADLGKNTERTLLRRVATKALEPIRDRAKALAPVDDGHLRDSLVIGASLTSNAKRADRREPREGVRMFMGTANRNAVPREYGSIRSGATPFVRPAWDEGAPAALKYVQDELGGEIEKTAARAAKRKGVS